MRSNSLAALEMPLQELSVVKSGAFVTLQPQVMPHFNN
jgi:hypothetical protein